MYCLSSMIAVQTINKIYPLRGILYKSVIKKIGWRTFLSNAYSCDELWQRRLDHPLIKDRKLNAYFIEVDKKFQTKRLASAVDIDLYIQKVTDPSHFDELEHLLYRFRRSKRAAEVLDSMHHAVVRIFLDANEINSLFRILRDRVDYGIFPNFYAYNLMMDTFIKTKAYRDAAEIAVLMMLQEDFTNPISRILGLYSCQMFMNECSLESWHSRSSQVEDLEQDTELKQDVEGDEQEEEEEEEEQLVRIPYLRNHWFDDHFDIRDPKTLIGKTFYLIGREEKNALGRTFQLIGLGMQKKWDKALKFLQQKDSLYEEGVTKFQEMLAEIEQDDAKEKWLLEFKAVFEKLQKENKVSSVSIMDALLKETKKIPELEPKDIESQKELFLLWEKEREREYQAQLKDIDKEQRLKKIAEMKEELYWKEKYFFYFEKEDDINIELKEVQNIIEQMKEKAQKQKVDTYKPPEIIKKKPTKLTRIKKLAMIKSLK